MKSDKDADQRKEDEPDGIVGVGLGDSERVGVTFCAKTEGIVARLAKCSKLLLERALSLKKAARLSGEERMPLSSM